MRESWAMGALLLLLLLSTWRYISMTLKEVGGGGEIDALSSKKTPVEGIKEEEEEERRLVVGTP